MKLKNIMSGNWRMVKMDDVKVLNFVYDFKLNNIIRKRRNISDFNDIDSEIKIENIKDNYDKQIDDLILFVIVPKDKEIPKNILEEKNPYFSFLISLDSSVSNTYKHYFDNFVELSSEEDIEKFILGFSLQIIERSFIGLDIADLKNLFLNKGQIYMKEFNRNNPEDIKKFPKSDSVFISMSYGQIPNLNLAFNTVNLIKNLLTLPNIDNFVMGLYEDPLQKSEENIIIYTSNK